MLILKIGQILLLFVRHAEGWELTDAFCCGHVISLCRFVLSICLFDKDLHLMKTCWCLSTIMKCHINRDVRSLGWLINSMLVNLIMNSLVL